MLMVMLSKHTCSAPNHSHCPQAPTLQEGYTNTDSLHKIILSIFSIRGRLRKFFQVISRQMYFFVFWNSKRCFFLSYLGPPSLANSPVYTHRGFTWKLLLILDDDEKQFLLRNISIELD